MHMGVCVGGGGVWVHLPVLSLSLGVCISCRKIQGETAMVREGMF